MTSADIDHLVAAVMAPDDEKACLKFPRKSLNLELNQADGLDAADQQIPETRRLVVGELADPVFVTDPLGLLYHLIKP